MDAISHRLFAEYRNISMSDRTMIKLNEEQMRDFVANGYISLKPDLPDGFHNEIYETTEKAFERVGNPGNNILPMVPQLQRVFDHPQILSLIHI